MAVVQGINEKLHFALYDSIHVDPGDQLSDNVKSSTLKLFVDVNGKTKLETNLQAASLLPHYNTFEARAMRVVISDLPPDFDNADKTASIDDPVTVYTDDASGKRQATSFKASGDVPIGDLMGALADARASDDDEGLITFDDSTDLKISGTLAANTDYYIVLSSSDILDLLDGADDTAPCSQQISDDGGSVTGNFIYNTVTTLYVGEKVMVSAPTWLFPAGAGVSTLSGNAMNHGDPTPAATFRFAEPIYIDRQQNFRVEIEIPDSETFKDVQKTYGPLFIWVLLDGYMTRAVQ